LWLEAKPSALVNDFLGPPVAYYLVLGSLLYTE